MLHSFICANAYSVKLSLAIIQVTITGCAIFVSAKSC